MSHPVLECGGTRTAVVRLPGETKQPLAVYVYSGNAFLHAPLSIAKAQLLVDVLQVAIAEATAERDAREASGTEPEVLSCGG